MRPPSFTGEASLYKTGQFYRGKYGRVLPADAASIRAAQVDCRTACWNQLDLARGPGKREH